MKPSDKLKGTSEVLKIGDYITLRYLDQGWLSAEGICFDDISISQSLTNFENCLWEIHVQNQYTALKEYEDVLFTTLSDDSESKEFEKSNVTDEILNQLHRAATNEGHLNTRLMSLKVGKPVLFGDIVQLKHVKSKKFLTVCSGTLAKSERENLRIHLDNYGDIRSWLEIIPKSKGDKEGQQISVHSEVLLRIHGRTSEFIHCAKKTMDGEEATEVNCSLESSSWVLSIYQDAFSARSSNILAGQVVCLQEVDSTAYLAPVIENLTEWTFPRATHVSLTNSNLLGFSNNMVGTHLLWILENTIPSVGGIVGIVPSTVTLKHLNTGMYLTIDPLAKSGNQSLYLNSEHTPSSDFEVISVDALDGLHDGAAVQLRSQGCWIFTPIQQSQQSNSAQLKRAHRTSSFIPSLSFEEVDSPLIPSRCSGTSEKSKASAFTIHNTLHLRLGPDLFLGVEAAKILKNFVLFGRNQSQEPTHVPNFTSKIKSVLSVLELIHQFLTDDILSTSTEHDGVEFFQIVETRQIMLREQGVLTAVVDLIELCGDDVVTALLSQEKCITPAINKSFSQSQATMKKMISQNSFGRASPFLSNRKLLSDAAKSPVRSPSKKLMATTLSSEARKDISRVISQEKLGPRRNPGIARAKTSRANLGNLISDFDSDQFHESQDGFPIEGGSDQSNSAKRTLVHDFSTACFKTLLAIIRDNHSNQMSIADKFPILLNQVKDQELAVACVQEMLRDNLQMLETKVSAVLVDELNFCRFEKGRLVFFYSFCKKPR